jgi:CheY-like chemotaxis protein
LGLSEALQSGVYGELSEKQLASLKMIESSGRHLLSLINDILDLSKIEAGQFEIKKDICSLSEVCQSSLHLMRGMTHQKRQDVRFSISPATILIHADVRRIKQMLVNLLGNAVKFTPEGGSLGIQVVGDPHEQQVSITVWDKGIGIRKEDQQRLFRPFVQLDSSLSRQYAGTGLGLALVQRLAQLHGGEVQVESVPGEGSRFTVLLPWETPPSLAALAAQGGLAALNAPAPAVHGLSGPRVLIADDNTSQLGLMCDFLGARNIQAVGVESGEELLQRVGEIKPDVLLVDIQMPGMDGLEVIRRIRVSPNPQISRLPVLAVTALAMTGDRERCLAAGADEYISKPVRLEELAELVRRLAPASPLAG